MIVFVKSWWAWRLTRPQYPTHPGTPEIQFDAWKIRYSIWLSKRPVFKDFT